jgi:gag-polypeptide of LTR copia-type/Zinc knuckle
MEVQKGFVAEGHSVSRPPFFDGTDYSYWKNRMQVFLRAQDYELWKIVSKGPAQLPEEEDTWTREQIKKDTLNWSALNMMQCAIHPKEFSRVSSCKSAKEMWDKLQLIYEGTSEVRETKASILVSDYESFRMKDEESISEMFARFMIIVNGLKGLGKDYKDSDLVRKILRSLLPTWHTKATVIEDSKNLSTMSLDELIGSLMTYEINLKRSESENLVKKKSLALKASSSTTSKNKSQKDSDSENASSKSDHEEISLLTRQFRKFMKYKLRGKNARNHARKEYGNKSDSYKKNDTLTCFQCRKPGHMSKDCPEKRKKFHKNKAVKKPKAMLAGTWSDEDESSSQEEGSEAEEDLCFMAKSNEDDEVSSQSEDVSFEDLQEAYNLLFEKFSMSKD